MQKDKLKLVIKKATVAFLLFGVIVPMTQLIVAPASYLVDKLMGYKPINIKQTIKEMTNDFKDIIKNVK